MTVILIKNSKVVDFYTNTFTITENGCYYITERNIQIPPFLCEAIIDVETPEDIEPGKYCWDNGFYRNPEWIKPPLEIPAEIKDAVVDEITKGVLADADTETA